MNHSRIPQEHQILLRVHPRLRPRRDLGHLIQLLGREMGSIRDRAKMGDEGSIDITDGRPVDAVEELGGLRHPRDQGVETYGMSFELVDR